LIAHFRGEIEKRIDTYQARGKWTAPVMEAAE
jgi:hypothetical protein